MDGFQNNPSSNLSQFICDKQKFGRGPSKARRVIKEKPKTAKKDSKDIVASAPEKISEVET